LLHFIAPAELRRFMVLGEDLNRRTLLARLLPSPARFSPSYLCRSCGIYVVDYGSTLSRGEANEAARSLTATPPNNEIQRTRPAQAMEPRR
jgi:hypothetical protein